MIFAMSLTSVRTRRVLMPGSCDRPVAARLKIRHSRLRPGPRSDESRHGGGGGRSILGPLEVVAGDRVLDIRGQKQRALLAILVVRANEVMSPDTLADELWAGGTATIGGEDTQAHISRLRDALVGASDDSGALTLQTHGHGYRLVLGPEQLDCVASRTFSRQGGS